MGAWGCKPGDRDWSVFFSVMVHEEGKKRRKKMWGSSGFYHFCAKIGRNEGEEWEFYCTLMYDVRFADMVWV